MTNNTEKTVPNVSVGADTEQPSQKCTVPIIPAEDENFNSFDDFRLRKFTVGFNGVESTWTLQR